MKHSSQLLIVYSHAEKCSKVMSLITFMILKLRFEIFITLSLGPF